MQGHASANLVPVVASNRTGQERVGDVPIKFYGSSFIADHTGLVLASLNREEEGVISKAFDLEECRRFRAAWGLFRDRRPELYRRLLTLDGRPQDAVA